MLIHSQLEAANFKLYSDFPLPFLRPSSPPADCFHPTPSKPPRPHHRSLDSMTRLKPFFRTRPVLLQAILALCIILTIIKFYPFPSDYLTVRPHVYDLIFPFNHTPITLLSKSTPPSISLSPPPPSLISNPHPPPNSTSTVNIPPSTKVPPTQDNTPIPSQPQADLTQPTPIPTKTTIPPIELTKVVSRPVVPHPLSPLPPPPPSSDQLCERCGCSSDKRIQRKFNFPDESVLKRSTHQTISIGPSDRSESIVTQIWSSIRDIYCHHILLSSGAALNLLDHTTTDSPLLLKVINSAVDTLQVGLPTQYIFTKTSNFSRVKDLRPQYFRRHAKAINDHLLNVSNRGGKYLPESEQKWGAGPRQLIWIVIEDGEMIDPEVQLVLAQSKLPFVYFAYGTTHRYGNAQQNAAYALIHRLSTTVLSHGPILSLDDDGKVLSDLFDITWRVRRIGVWPMGNLGPRGWEGPEYDPVTKDFLTWHRHPHDDRPFPLDNGAFAFSSEVFGSNFRLTGPRYWPTDYAGGENEFVSQIVSKQELLEPLCYNCRVAWHNSKLPENCIKYEASCQEL